MGREGKAVSKASFKHASSTLKWLPPDDEILREIWASRTPLKVTVARLPGRSVRSLERRAAELELPRRRQAVGTSDTRPAFVALWAQLKKKRGTRIELAGRAGVTPQTAAVFIKHFRAQMHVGGWRTSPHGPAAPIYVSGAGEDVPRPPRQTRSEICSRWWKRTKREWPDVAAARIAKTTFKRLERQGKVIRRDPAVAALFGPAPASDDR